MAALLGFAVACGGQKTEDKKTEEAAPVVEAVEVVEEAEVAPAPETVVKKEEAKPGLQVSADVKVEAETGKVKVSKDVTKAENNGATLKVTGAKPTAPAKAVGIGIGDSTK